jgi:hypothetical protein
VVLGLYFISLFSCLIHRRRKRLRLEAQQGRIQVSEEAPPLPDNNHQGSLSSVVRTQSLAEEDEMIEKYEPVFILDGFNFHSHEGYQSTGTMLGEESRELSSEPRSPRERCDCGCGRESRVQSQENSFEQDENIG